MHLRLKCITILQCTVGNLMQIVLWRVMLNYVLAKKKRQKNKGVGFWFCFFFNCLFFGFQSSCQRHRFKPIV